MLWASATVEMDVHSELSGRYALSFYFLDQYGTVGRLCPTGGNVNSISGNAHQTNGTNQVLNFES